MSESESQSPSPEVVKMEVKKPLSAADKMKELEDKIARLDETKKKLAAMKQAIQNREKEKERKARTHRLCQCMPLVEKYLGIEGIEPEQLEKILKMMVANKGFNTFFTGCLKTLDSENLPVNASPATNSSQVPVSSASIQPANSPVSVGTLPLYESSIPAYNGSAVYSSTSGILAYSDQTKK